ncbi:MAG: asparagine synthase (glutamine-hydrolyzing) [Cytophagaceae bacterium]|jgi:asparagine synthase (glutamine-hydrolysing)|nr:asparagine synthase (glutamine-hydrolyzing) [Cytophagaceae bacterium]
MCGIAGFIHPQWGQSEIVRMADAIAHRGPDAAGYYKDPDYPLFLSHRRLSIIDLQEASNQPFHSACGRYVMVFNGEIYNYQDLRKRFQLSTRTQSDTEVLLELFIQQGPSILSSLNGMFAFVVWDTKDQKLWLCRDRFGVKPLVYATMKEGIAFSSELKSLYTLPIPKTLNTTAIADYLLLEYIPKPNTIFKSFKKFPNGHYATYTVSEGLQFVRYYDLKNTLQDQPEATKDVESNSEELLRSAVSFRLISDVPVGAFLSGGTDSSLVVSYFQSLRQQHPAETFTIGFDVDSHDERYWARQVAQHLGTSHHEYPMGAQDLETSLADFITFFDEPFASSSALATSLVCRQARTRVTVALSGDGGDETCLGYGVYPLYSKMRQWYAGLGKYGFTAIAKGLSYGNINSQRLQRYFQAYAKHPTYMTLWSQDQYMFHETEISRLIGVPYKHETTLHYWASLERFQSTPRTQAALMDMEYYMADNLLYKVDQTSMRHALEVRNPFLDYRWVEHAFYLSEENKINKKEQKYILKKLLEKQIPRQLVYRKKWGFPAPVGEWIKGEKTFLMDEYLSDQRIKTQGIFDPDAVRSIITEFKNGHEYHFKRIWALLVFQMWHQHQFGK